MAASVRSRRRTGRRIALGAGLPVLAIGALGAFAWRASSAAIHPAPARPAWTVSDFPALAAHDLTVHSATGVTLRGRFFPGRTGATVILTHGYGGSQDEMLPVA